MVQRIYLGIDESNHGRFPEIFVCVYSFSVEDFMKKSSLLPKMRSNKNIDDIVEKCNFVHSLIKEPPINNEEYECKRLAVLATLIQKCSKEYSEVIIDGKFDKHLPALYLAVDILGIDIRSEIGADTRYNVVNQADMIAYHISNYERKNPTGKKFSDTLVLPSAKIYQNIVRLQGAVK